MVRYDKLKSMGFFLSFALLEVIIIYTIFKLGLFPSLPNESIAAFILSLLTELTLMLPLTVLLISYLIGAFKQRSGIFNEVMYRRFCLVVLVILAGITAIQLVTQSQRVFLWGAYLLISAVNLCLFYGGVKRAKFTAH